MKDFIGNEICIGDTVAIVYHPEAYSFSVKPAIITRMKGKQIVTQLLNTDIEAGFMPDASGELYRKVVKIDAIFPELDEGATVDAVGHEVKVGDKIVCRMPTEGAGNTVKGFMKGGNVVKITEKYAFYLDETTGKTLRKGLNGSVVIDH